MQLNQFLPEATSPYLKKAIDPALMTFSEYHNLVNPDHKMHDSKAYDSDLKDLNRYDDADSYAKLMNTINKNGITFEVRMKATDR